MGRNGIQSACDNLERVAHCDAGALGAVVYADDSCHGAKIKKVAGIPTQRPAPTTVPLTYTLVGLRFESVLFLMVSSQ